MKQLIQRTLSLILALSMVLALSVPSFAYSRVPETFEDDITQEEIDALREAFSALSPEAKEIYLASLYQDPEALAFHRQYIDSSLSSRALSYGLCYANAAVANAANADVVTNLVRQLQAIQGMPTELVNAFRIMASGMVADMADGPLPFGAIIAAAGTAAVVVIMANNWEKVSPMFPRIVAAFKQAFSDSASQIVSAFNSIKAEVLDIVAPSVSVSGKTITVGKDRYTCNTKAEDLTAEQKKGKYYYPAVLYRDVLHVDPSHKLSASTAKTILSFNSSVAGIMATTETLARGVSGSNAQWHDTHSYGCGYYKHYHPSYAPSAHCWYII